MQRPNSEKLNLKFNISEIYSSLQEKMQKQPPLEVYPGYGGWSLLSSDGSITGGWNEAAVVLDKNLEMNEEETVKKFSKLNLPSTFEHTKPSGFFTEPVEKMVEILKKEGFELARLRLSFLKPGAHIYWHTDVNPRQYGVRLHVPLITNKECFFEYTDEKIHLPADGSAYMIRVNKKHRYSNGGTAIRYHLIMDIRDVAHKTEQFRYPLDI